MEKKGKFNSRTLIARYTGMGMELFVLLMVLFFLGDKIDQYFKNDKSYISVTAMVIGLTAYLYRVYRDSSIEREK